MRGRSKCSQPVRPARAFALLVLLLAAFGPGGATAQVAELPKTVTVHVGFAPGGPADVIARIVAEKLAEKTGSTIVVLNRAGAGGTLAAEAVARLAPDGANLLLVTSGHAGAPAQFPNLRFDNQRDFTPIIALAQSPVILLVAKASPHKSSQDLIAAARANPGKLNFGTGGGGATLTALSAIVLRKELGYDAVAVPFQGAGPAAIALMGGSIDRKSVV